MEDNGCKSIYLHKRLIMVKNILLFFLLIVSISSCKVLTSTDMFRTDTKFAYDPVNNKIKEIRIQPGDKLTIMMSTNNGLTLLENSIVEENRQSLRTSGTSVEYLVDFDSTIRVPSIGRIRVGGYTLREMEAVLEDKFSENYQKPFVTVKITNRKLYMFFEQATTVKTISLTEQNMTLVDAIAQVGGVPQNSKAYTIKVIRGDRLNPKVFNFSVRTLSDFKNNNLLLEANDIVYVDSRPRYITKSINELQPYFLLISTTVLLLSVYNQYFK